MKIIQTMLCLLISYVSWSQSSQYESYIKDGIDLKQRRKLQFAEEQFKKAIALDSNRVEAYYELGATYDIYYQFENSHSDDCIFYFNKALIKDSTYKQIRLSLGYIRGITHDFSGSLRELNIAINIKPDTTAYLQRALVKLKLNDSVGVCEDIAKAISLGSTKARFIALNKLGGVNCNIALKEPENILHAAYTKVMENPFVSYEVTYYNYNSSSNSRETNQAKCKLMRPGDDTTMGFYFRIEPNDTTFFFSNMKNVWGVNKKRNAATAYDAYYFITNWLVGDNLLGAFVWTYFAQPEKLKEKTEAPLILEPKTDTVFDGNACYRVLVKYPDDTAVTKHTLLIHFSKKDNMPFYLISQYTQNNTIYTNELIFKNYSFGNRDYSTFSKDQIPENYKTHIFNPKLDK